MFSNERKYVNPYGRAGKKELGSIERRKPLCEKKMFSIKGKNAREISKTYTWLLEDKLY